MASEASHSKVVPRHAVFTHRPTLFAPVASSRLLQSSAAIAKSAPSATETLPSQTTSTASEGDETKAEIDGIQKLEAEVRAVNGAGFRKDIC